MIADILFCYWGLRLSAPTWYFVLIGITFTLRLFSFGMKMYKAGAKL